MSRDEEIARILKQHGERLRHLESLEPFFDVPSAIALANAEGVSNYLARLDHIHAHGSGYLPDAHHARSHDHSVAGDSTDVVPNRLIHGLGADLTISGGVITVTHSHHRVDTEGGAATDNLDTINGGVAGQRLILRSVAGARDIVVRDGAGNIECGANFTLGTFSDIIELFARTNFTWVKLNASTN